MTALPSEAKTAIKLLKTKVYAALMQICSTFKLIQHHAYLLELRQGHAH